MQCHPYVSRSSILKWFYLCEIETERQENDNFNEIKPAPCCYINDLDVNSGNF